MIYLKWNQPKHAMFGLFISLKPIVSLLIYNIKIDVNITLKSQPTKSFGLSLFVQILEFGHIEINLLLTKEHY